VGLDQVAGYLDGGIVAWDRAGLPLQKMEQIPVEELQHRLTDGLVDQVLDVRRPAEWETGHIASARSTPLLHLAQEAEKMDPKRRVAVLCAGGFRSAIASSLLEQQGFEQVSNVVGGMAAWTAAKLPVAQ
jgi:hydroxyacylglutathione hydrolase